MDTKNLREIANKVIGRIIPQVLSIKEELLSVIKSISSTFKSDMPHNKKREQLLKTLMSLSMKSKVSLAGGLIVFISIFGGGGGSVVADIESDEGMVCTSSCENVEGLNLSDKTWANFKFSGVNFDDVTFDNVKFYGTKFENVTFTNANFIFDQTLDIGELSNVEIKSSAIEVSNPPDGGQYFYIAGENISLSNSSLKGVSINLASPDNNVTFDNVLLQESTVLLSANELISSYQEQLEPHFWTNLDHREPEKRNVNLNSAQKKGLGSLISELNYSEESKELAKIRKIYVDECKISALENLILELAECNKDLGAAVEAYLEKVNNVKASIALYSKEVRESINGGFVGQAMLASKDYFTLRAYIDEGSQKFVDIFNDQQVSEGLLLIHMEYFRDNSLIEFPKLRKLMGENFSFSTEENFDKFTPLKWQNKTSFYQISSDSWNRDGLCKAELSLEKIYETMPFELAWFYKYPNSNWLAEVKNLKNQLQKFAQNSSIAEINDCLEVMPNLTEAIWGQLGLAAELIDRLHGEEHIHRNFNRSGTSEILIKEEMFDDKLPIWQLQTNSSFGPVNQFTSNKVICINSYDDAVKPLRPNEWKFWLKEKKLSKARCGELNEIKDYFLFAYGYPAPEWVTARGNGS